MKLDLDTDSFGGISTNIWYLQFHFVCDKLLMSFRLILNLLLLLYLVQLADRTLNYSKRSFYFFLLA